MRFPAALLLSGTLVVPVLSAQKISISGYVTRVASRSDFDVNRIRIECNKNTNSGIIIGDKMLGRLGCPKTDVYVGESARVEGSFDKAHASMKADTIGFIQTPGDELSGSAVIDRVPFLASSPAAAGELVVRADGYLIHIPGKALIVWVAPLHSFSDVKVGDWIDYVGRQQADGTIVANKVKITPIQVKNSEQKFRKKSEFDPSKVPATARQNVLTEAFIGVNYKKIPPSSDTALQARINDIGSKLIPAFQRNLASTDPARIDFRFQLTADPKWREVAPLPSGIILIPRKAAERMQNDSQLAALLAGGIASALERGPYRMRGAVRATTLAAYVYNPIYGPGVAAGARAVARHKQQEQSGRVALALMHDAGYDIDQAPVAWWLLGAKTPKPTSEIPLPGRAAYLYKILGECWNNPGAVAARR